MLAFDKFDLVALWPLAVPAILVACAIGALILRRRHHPVFAEALDVAAAVIVDHEHGDSVVESLMKELKSDKARDVWKAAIDRAKITAVLILAFGLVFSAGCSAEALAREEAAAHTALTYLEKGIDWANANPATVQAILDDAAKKSDDPALQKAISKAKALVAAGDLQAAQEAVWLGIALTDPTPAAAPK